MSRKIKHNRDMLYRKGRKTWLMQSESLYWDIKIYLCAHSCSLSLSAQLTNLTEIHDQISGMARCPYNPLHNSTALITSSGELYAATAMDFSGRDPAIYRSLGGLPPLRTAQYNSKWLNGKALEYFLFCTYIKTPISVWTVGRFILWIKGVYSVRYNGLYMYSPNMPPCA